LEASIAVFREERAQMSAGPRNFAAASAIMPHSPTQRVVMSANNELQAHIVAARGTIHLRLFPDQTPLTVANFVNLVVRKYYDGLSFHRVIPDFMIQAGCPEGSGRGGPGYTFEDEIVPTLKHDSAGVLSMANAGPGTNGSQFFITHVATPWLDGKHTVFGHIVGSEDRDIVDAIRTGEKIGSITIRGDYAPLFEKVRGRLERWNQTLDSR
jgi:peptidyl-prolyl cis-trans isomerase B (cyclophilin B)